MNKTRQVTLSFNSGQFAIDLYVSPKSIKITRPQNTQKYRSVLGYELNLSAGIGLRQVTIEAMMPQTEVYGSGMGGFRPPAEIVDYLKSWQDSRRPIRMVVSGTDINHPFLIEDLSQTFIEGDADVYLTLALREYRFVYATVNQNDAMPSLKPTGEDKTPTAKTYVVVKGDTLWEIAGKYYYDCNRWLEIANRNGIKNQYELQIGTVLQL